MSSTVVTRCGVWDFQLDKNVKCTLSPISGTSQFLLKAITELSVQFELFEHSEFISSDPKSNFKEPRWNKQRFRDEWKIPGHNTRLHVCGGDAIFERTDACHMAAVHLLDIKLVSDLFYNL